MSLKKTSKRGHSTMNELNITPLLDLVFVLLVIFIITTPQLVNNLEINLPSPKPPVADNKPKPKPVKLSVDRVPRTEKPLDLKRRVPCGGGWRVVGKKPQGGNY